MRAVKGTGHPAEEREQELERLARPQCAENVDTPHVVSHSLGYEDRPPLGAIVNSSVTFADGSCIHFKEFLQLRPVITRLKYAYHYATYSHTFVFSPHYP